MMAKVQSIAEFRRRAQARLPRPVFDFADGGAEDEDTLRANERAFERWQLLPQPLRGAATRDLSVELFGQRLAVPFLIGPTGLAGLFWPRGEVASARAAHRMGTVYCLSHGSVCSMETLAQSHAGLRWMQVFIYKDRGFTRELAERARESRFSALILTVDNQLLGKRERDLANGFAIPPRFGLRELAHYASKPRWWWSMRRELPRLSFGNYLREGSPASVANLAGKMAGMLDPAMNWDDVAWLRTFWPGPLLLKGILHPTEAAQAARIGVDALIVSNHGGRQLDGAIASLDALPAVLDAVGSSLPVLLDGGVRRGSHALKALALGARAVLLGRPQLWALASDGEAGVYAMLEMLRQELDRSMGLCGLTNIGALATAMPLAPPRAVR
jgi:L-lactate dehydrogenase (cytochrome)/(S)-mandelate dehydrogenase